MISAGKAPPLAKRRYRMKKVATIYWLLPAKPERDLLCEVVRILRQEFQAPNFEPHLTLFASTKDRQPPKKFLREISIRPIRLTTRGVGFSSEFTKTLFVRFRPSDELRKLVAELSRAAKTKAKVSNDPHVSLLYKKLPAAPKK